VPLLDLLLFKRGRRFGVEITRIDAPTLIRSMRIAPANLQPSGRAFRFNKLAANLFFSLCHSAPFVSSKVFEPLLVARDLKWACVMSACHLTAIDPFRSQAGGSFRASNPRPNEP
jgi:hypothetical protein